MGARELSELTVGEIMEAAEGAGYDPYQLVAGVIARRPDALDVAHRILRGHLENFHDGLEVA